MAVEKIEKFSEVLDNAYNFNKGSEDEDSKEWKTCSIFSQFSNWYYFPAQDFFAPNKFIGYKNTTCENYKSDGYGGETKKALANFFNQVDPSSDEFVRLSTKLEEFAKSVKRKISKRTYTEGGIFIPKNEFYSSEENFNDTLVQGGEPISVPEGNKKKRFLSYRERNPLLREIVIRNKGLICCACGFDFCKTYGDRGRGYIEVHHTKPVAGYEEEHLVDWANDMEVVCSNCHRMIHRSRNNVLSINDLKKFLKR